ncbi:hypothetical protein [Massilia sp. HP4]|uniref:hypothetical protein n=1 Tax=Massilia sp. HP4 TaxID=2562316 RepID=UPI001E4DAB3B|nr:hypothetical protein [Massilia sp. HP4]
MFTMILLLYLQQNLDVVLESSSLRGPFANRAACEEAAIELRGPLPTPEGLAAAWHDALCVPVARGVTVRERGPPDLGALLRERPPADCGADGAWRRVAKLCLPSAPPAAPHRAGASAPQPISPSAPSSQP